ncbi:outer membrane protein transport protein [Dokdonia sp. Hel_I_53]|uniref:outer membrane protein transport protein n=1 Tax=Dokdonia sp. Hel_I_53 TaxID=1566287 RepID=UPI00119B77E5|nr:outer membrane protein transport protein [Dokdonia sp. Hel_I_53]TVZ51814.1 outer membrane protein transport protein (OMPP1/FadL/TodX) [Dokdonia sp. Hel_I_53]
MKKIIFLIVVMTTGASFAQTISEALQYSSVNVTGTARYRAMNGAFGALGGDLSAIGDNPASSAVFTNGTATFTLASDHLENEASYFGGNTIVSNTDTAINQLGGVFILDGTSGTKWNKITLGFNYDRTSNFNNQYIAQGFNLNSISEYFAIYAQGVPLSDLETRENESIAQLYQFLGEDQGYGSQQALLGFQSYILEPTSYDSNNTTYGVNTVGTVYDQEYTSLSSGSNGKASFNIAAQYGDDLYLGINLNSHFLDTNRSTVLFESNNAGAPPANEGFTNVTDIRFENNLRTLGSGFSFQVGAISKFNDNIRLGFTYESPTWYTISEENTQRLSTTSIDDLGIFTTQINPEVVNVYQDYEIKTPGKYTSSVAYVFGSQGLISFDYSYRDMTNLRFRPERDPFFNSKNNEINDILRAVNTFKLGAEMRSNKWSYRAGGRYETSPYHNQNLLGATYGYSAGLGYNFGQIKIDVAYDQFFQDSAERLYSVGLIDRAQINKTNSSLVGTLTLSL